MSSRSNFIFGPFADSAWKQPKIASHADPAIARHLFAKPPQRTTRALCVAAMRELRPHLAGRVSPRADHLQSGRPSFSASSLTSFASPSPRPRSKPRKTEPPWTPSRSSGHRYRSRRSKSPRPQPRAPPSPPRLSFSLACACRG